MSPAIIWWIVAAVLVAAELTTGTFYLLILAAAMSIAGVAAWVGAGLVVQTFVAALIGIGGSLWLRRVRSREGSGRRGRHPPDPIQHLDVGQRIRVTGWNANRTARASHRGADWDIELEPDTPAADGEFQILEVRGSRLVVGQPSSRRGSGRVVNEERKSDASI